ncbi:MAG: radical SAM family heme chaperone HemW [Geminicoccaceae bacterium]|nr:radical SAM family heme chaperone HemW [Geminicoccaceae bacterium]
MQVVTTNSPVECRLGQALATGAAAPLSLYVHWPFCRSKCPYCDFNSHVAPEVDHDAWACALLQELQHFAGQLGRRRLVSVFFGGGTPSLMAPETVGALLDLAADLFELAPDLEVTLEANPTSVEAARFRSFRAAGVNRVSLGVQALDDRALRFLGREHGVEEALSAVALARRLFARTSFDLIYARPEQTERGWREELKRALEHVDGHLSVYQLTIEDGTRFRTLVDRGALHPLDPDLQAALFEATQEQLADAGLPAYEISNHARPGEECRHNLTYWRYGEYIGIGPGAHGRLVLDGRRVATETVRMPRAWLDRTLRTGHAERPRTVVSPDDQVVEMLIMGLRLTEGISIDGLEKVASRPLEEIIPRSRIEQLTADGFLADDRLRLRATAAGQRRLDAVLMRLLGSV